MPTAQKTLAVLAAGALLLSLSLTGCSSTAPSKDAQPEETVSIVPAGSVNAAPSAIPSQNKPSPTQSPTQSPTTLPDVTFSVAVTGDYLPHTPILNYAKRKGAGTPGGYDFTSTIEAIKPWIEPATIGLCHQEAMFAPTPAQISTFPAFGMPDNFVHALQHVGYDGCSTASNHSWDKGRAGLVHTMELFDLAGMGVVGTARSAAEDVAQIYEVTQHGRTIKVAHISMTYGLNQGRIRELRNEPWLVHVNDTQRVVEIAYQARVQGADVVIASVHDGMEYKVPISAMQAKRVRDLGASGVIDVFVGHHVHVPQKIGVAPGGVGGGGMWTYYGLGNLFSSMGPDLAPGTQYGTLGYFEITVPGTPGARAAVTKAQWTGLALDRGAQKVWPFAAFAQGAPPGATISKATVDRYRATMRGIVGPEAEEIMAPPAPSDATVKVVPRPR
ncbi:MAG: CapA family protein [Actinomycetaceae bacterium]|nr:CapA family protein [Actinomycetaceae bacterium]